MLNEFRCKKCRKLLAKVSDYSDVEIKCSRCKQLNYQNHLAKSEMKHAKQRPVILTDDLHNNC